MVVSHDDWWVKPLMERLSGTTPWEEWVWILTQRPEENSGGLEGVKNGTCGGAYSILERDQNLPVLKKKTPLQILKLFLSLAGHGKYCEVIDLVEKLKNKDLFWGKILDSENIDFLSLELSNTLKKLWYENYAILITLINKEWSMSAEDVSKVLQAFWLKEEVISFIGKLDEIKEWKEITTDDFKHFLKVMWKEEYVLALEEIQEVAKKEEKNISTLLELSTYILELGETKSDLWSENIEKVKQALGIITQVSQEWVNLSTISGILTLIWEPEYISVLETVQKTASQETLSFSDIIGVAKAYDTISWESYSVGSILEEVQKTGEWNLDFKSISCLLEAAWVKDIASIFKILDRLTDGDISINDIQTILKIAWHEIGWKEVEVLMDGKIDIEDLGALAKLAGIASGGALDYVAAIELLKDLYTEKKVSQETIEHALKTMKLEKYNYLLRMVALSAENFVSTLAKKESIELIEAMILYMWLNPQKTQEIGIYAKKIRQLSKKLDSQEFVKVLIDSSTLAIEKWIDLSDIFFQDIWIDVRRIASSLESIKEDEKVQYMKKIPALLQYLQPEKATMLIMELIDSSENQIDDIIASYIEESSPERLFSLLDTLLNRKRQDYTKKIISFLSLEDKVKYVHENFINGNKKLLVSFLKESTDSAVDILIWSYEKLSIEEFVDMLGIVLRQVINNPREVILEPLFHKVNIIKILPYLLLRKFKVKNDEIMETLVDVYKGRLNELADLFRNIDFRGTFWFSKWGVMKGIRNALWKWEDFTKIKEAIQAKPIENPSKWE